MRAPLKRRPHNLATASSTYLLSAKLILKKAVFDCFLFIKFGKNLGSLTKIEDIELRLHLTSLTQRLTNQT